MFDLKNPSSPNQNKFESLDFCYDLIQEMEERKLKHICIFIQITENIDKVHTSHSNFNLEEAQDIVPKICVFAIEKLEIGTIEAKFDFVNKITASIRKQGIDYVVMFIIDGDLHLAYSLKNEEAINIASVTLGSIPYAIMKFLNKEPLKNDEDNNDNDDDED